MKRNPEEVNNDVTEHLVSLAIDAEPLSDEAIHSLEEALEEIRQGNLIPEKVILKKYCSN